MSPVYLKAEAAAAVAVQHELKRSSAAVATLSTVNTTPDNRQAAVAALSDGVSTPGGLIAPAATSTTTTQKLLSMRSLQEKSLAAAAAAAAAAAVTEQDAYTTCLKAATCGYDSYGQSALYQTGPIQPQRPYPMMPQAGYTSVIVDAQQYQMANGYVH